MECQFFPIRRNREKEISKVKRVSEKFLATSIDTGSRCARFHDRKKNFFQFALTASRNTLSPLSFHDFSTRSVVL